MKKQTLLKLFLILLPVLAVGLATTGNSVTVFDSQTGTTAYYSYFDLLPVATMRMVTPLAGILSILAGGFAIGSVVSKQSWCRKTVKWLSIAAATVAVLPILVRGDVLVVPNVGFPIFMGAEWILAWIMDKKPGEKTAEQSGPRLRGK